MKNMLQHQQSNIFWQNLSTIGTNTDSLYNHEYHDRPFTFDFDRCDNHFGNTRLLEIKNDGLSELLLSNQLNSLSQHQKFIALIGAPFTFNQSWFKKHNLPLTKFIQINTSKPSIQNMRLLLRSLSLGNISGAICWLPELSNEQREQIIQAAEYGESVAMILPLNQLH